MKKCLEERIPWGHNEKFLRILHRRSFQCPENSADGGDGEIGVPRPKCYRVVSVRAVAMTMHEHPNYEDGDLPKSGCGLRCSLHLWNGSLSMIHLVVNDAEKLRRAVNGVGAPSMVQTTTSILVVNMLGPIVDKRGPLFAAPWIFGYAILKKITLYILEKLLLGAFTSTCLKSFFFITLTVDCDTSFTLHLALCCSNEDDGGGGLR